MRDARKFLEQYRLKSLMLDRAPRDPKLRDVASVELCLAFLHRHFPGQSVEAMPFLLQGHLSASLTDVQQTQLFVLRQLTANLASRLAWRKALDTHLQFSGVTAYVVADGRIEPRPSAPLGLAELLFETMSNISDYSHRELRLAHGNSVSFKAHDQEEGRKYTFWLPTIEENRPERLQLRSRSVNPPIVIARNALLRMAESVDQREAAPDFPAWIKPLHLHSRLKKVEIENVAGRFYQGDFLTLDGVQHVVGMLSSGKSTLLYALLFMLTSPGYDKRVGVVVPDTASGAALLARLKGHGLNDAMLLSSFRRREEHLSAVHWASESFPQDQRSAAGSALGEPFGLACPLEGFQPTAGSSNLNLPKNPLPLSEKPCHSLEVPGADTKLTCPLIANCPSHAEHAKLRQARVIIITPQALLQMRPDKSLVAEEMSYPELLQYLVDVVLVDEADSVQRTFDESFTQKQDLLSSESGSFVAASIRALTQAVSDRAGGQYMSPSNVAWHRALNRLQDSISAIYHLLLAYPDSLTWLTYKKPFTTASILADLYVQARNNSSDKSDFVSDRRILEQLAVVSSALYQSTSGAEQEEETPGRLDSNMSGVLKYLKQLRLEAVEMALEGLDSKNGTMSALVKAVESGVLSLFKMTEADVSARKKRRLNPYAPPRPSADTASTARCVLLAVLTSECLSSYAYLVRHQGAVEEDFGLSGESAFRRARHLIDLYGSILPRPLLGTVFGLMYDQSSSESGQGGTLRLINHLGVGRYLLTHFDRLLRHAAVAGPHTLLVSGTSWAGGNSPTASPTYDIQVPVHAILRQPDAEVQAIHKSRFELVSILDTPVAVSGSLVKDRRILLARMAERLGKPGASGQSMLCKKWDQLADDEAFQMASRRRALIVTNNYDDARIVANALSASAGSLHRVYCLISDSLARTGELQKHSHRIDAEYSKQVVWLPRSQVEEFGASEEGAVLVAPLLPISRGHNIVTNQPQPVAAISAIYFLHRPHPRPDDLDGITGAVNRAAMEIESGNIRPDHDHAELNLTARWAGMQLRTALDEGFGLRSSYQLMSTEAREQYSWDLITRLWQTIGRGIRTGVPVYVGFADKQFAPGLFDDQADTAKSSCLVQCVATLQAAIESTENQVAEKLYGAFSEALAKMIDEGKRAAEASRVANKEAA
ncbi:MAG: hypothetical protein SF172_04130 [Burkholderiales bacterium]|nr:hypothetical protein [Burkholderiales bacterium]